MAQYYTEFSGDSVGSPPSGWTERFVSAGAAYAIASATAEAVNNTGLMLRITKTATQRNLLSFDQIDGDANRDNLKIAALVKFTPLDADSVGLYLGGRGSQAGTQSASINFAGGGFSRATTQKLREIFYLSGGATQSPSASDPNHDLTAGEWCWLRVELSSSHIETTLARFAAPETILFTSSFSTGAVLTAGWGGLFSFRTGLTWEIAAVGFGTNGDAAPTSNPSKTVSADAGTFILTGQDVTLTDDTPGSQAMSADAGTFLLTGQDVTLTKTGLEITGTNLHVINLDTNEVYYSIVDTTNETRPASLTKFMTAYVLLQHKSSTASLADTVTITSGDLSAGGSGANLSISDVVSLHGLLFNAMLPSSNNSCLAIARTIGQKILDDEGTTGDAEAKFIAEMNIQASALGMSNTNFVDPHGFANSNSTTPADMNLVIAELRNNEVLRNIWRFQTYRLPIERPAGSPTTISITATNVMIGDIGVFGGKTGTISGTANLSILWEAPNGQELAFTLMGSTQAERYNDMRAAVSAVQADNPELASAAVPFTPAYLFDTLGYNGGWFQPTDTANMRQGISLSSTAVTSAGDPVGRWDPVSGNGSIFFRQASATAKPTFQTTHLDFDGADYLDLGSGTFGNTGLFASSGQAFVVGQKYATSLSVATCIARAGATASGRTFQSYHDIANGVQPGLYIRGQTNGINDGLADGNTHNIHVWWDGTDGGHDRNLLGSRGLHVGTAVEETSENIILGARTGGAGAFLNGDVYDIVLVDNYDRESFRRLRDWFNGGTVNAFADPFGGNPTMSADAGTFAHTGQAVAFDIAIAAETGAFLLAGQDVTLTDNSATSFVLTADAGSFALTGQAVAFDVTIAVDAVAFVEAGQDAAFGVGIVVGAGSFNETGQAASFNITMQADSGNYVLTGEDVAFLTSEEIAAETGTFILTGQDIDLLLSSSTSVDSGAGSGKARDVDYWSEREKYLEWLREMHQPTVKENLTVDSDTVLEDKSDLVSQRNSSILIAQSARSAVEFNRAMQNVVELSELIDGLNAQLQLEYDTLIVLLLDS